MLTEKQLNRYADVLLWGLQTAGNRKAAKRDLVLVRFDLKAVRLAEILYAKLLEADAHPLLRMNPTSSMEYDYYTYSGNQLDLTKQMKRKLGFNQSALHWDFVNTEKKRVSAHLKSGKNVTIYENGKFNY